MPFGGGAFEEFVAEYIRYMPRYEGYMVEAGVDYKREKQLQQQIRGVAKQAYWSDIDVLAVTRDRAIVVSCDENCAKKLDQIVDELSFAEEFVRRKFPFVEEVKKLYAFCISWSRKEDRKKLQELQELHGVEILTYVRMVREFLVELRKKEKYGVTAGKFTEPIMWALRELDMIRVLTNQDIFQSITPSVNEARERSKITSRRKFIVEW